jgi:CRP/FNR family transcriptional regulator, anaerobic regulatory protein
VSKRSDVQESMTYQADAEVSGFLDHRSAGRWAPVVPEHGLDGLRLTSCTLANRAASLHNSLINFAGVVMTGSNGTIALRDELELGRRGLTARFRASPPCHLKAGEPLAAVRRSGNAIYHLVEGWACRFHSFSDGRQAIVDVYLPGDIIGLDSISKTRSAEEVITLTSIVTEAIDGGQGLTDLMTCRSIAVYIGWLLGQRQRQTEHHVAALSALDARGRLATMVLDFYTRLSRQRLITGSTYSLPLTQVHIAAYLGLTVAHVNRVLRCLRDEQILSFERHCMTILDLSRLKKVAQKSSSPSTGFDQLSSNEPPLSRKSAHLNEGLPVGADAAD